MPKGANMQKRIGTLDRETGFLVDAGYVKCSEVKSALRIINHQIWIRTLAGAGVAPVKRGPNGHQAIRLDEAKRLLAAQAEKPP